jgi:6-phosphogluconolactonase
MNSNKIIAVAQNPYSKQNRLTLTGPVINAAAHIYFLVTGSSKAKIVKQIFENSPGYLSYPAAHIKANNGKLTWMLDKEAAAFLP